MRQHPAMRGAPLRQHVRPSAASTALKALPTEKNYIDTGKVRSASNDLPLDFHPKAQRAAEAAWCAGEQNKYWEQRDTMINNSGDLSKDAITKYAQTISLNLASFAACTEAAKYNAVRRDI